MDALSQEYYVRRQIAQQQEYLSTLLRQREELERRHADLNRLFQRFDEVRVDFERRQRARAAAVARFSHRRASSRIARRYQDGMHGLITGSDSGRAASGLNAGAQRIRGEIDLTSRRENQIMEQIRHTRALIERLQYQLRLAHAAYLEQERQKQQQQNA